MKRLFLIMVLALISLGASSQWYYREYGVKDLSLMTSQQLDNAVHGSKSYIKGGLIVCAVSTLGILGGFSVMNNAYDEPEWDVGLGNWLLGFMLTTVSIGSGIVGIVCVSIGSARLSELNDFMKKNKIKTGLVNIPVRGMVPNHGNHFCPGIAITFSF
jgi:uncharacterized BrkB/YihY/UPF0761 family membrane protein